MICVARIAAALGDGVRDARAGRPAGAERASAWALRAAVVGAQGVGADAGAHDREGDEEHAERHGAILAAA